MKKILIISAIIWAAVILSVSYLYKGTENYQILFGILLVAAVLENGFIYNYMKKEKLKK